MACQPHHALKYRIPLRGAALFRMLVLLIAFSTALTIGAARAQDEACPGENDLAPRLEIGHWGQVISGTANNLRAEPGLQAARVGRLPAADIFRVVDGPRCADGYLWWQVGYDGLTAWTAEGSPDSGDYWLASFESVVAPAEVIPGCQPPPDAYDRLTLGFATLNLRTLAMLDHAQQLYHDEGGLIHFRQALMQGSYNPGGVSASFGTHDGGGALDLSVRDPLTGAVLDDQIPLMIRALRTAGFAAWLRDTGELYPGSPIHIHAIAIGDAELSQAARDQLDGTFGYFRGYNGLPQENGTPLPDTSGDLIVCAWMSALGYSDLRETG